MDVLFWVTASFGAGVWVGVHHRKSQQKSFRQLISKNRTFRSEAQPTTCTHAPSPRPAVKYQHSRWEEKEDLFWGMVEEGVTLENKKYMTTSTERQYLEKLKEWFGQYCRIFCQVSPGRFLKLPEQNAFSAKELVSLPSLMRCPWIMFWSPEKITKLSASLNWMIKAMNSISVLHVINGSNIYLKWPVFRCFVSTLTK